MGYGRVQLILWYVPAVWEEGLLNAAEQFNLVLHHFSECHWWLGVMTMTAVPAAYGYLLLPPLAAVHQLQVFHPAQSGEVRHEIWMG